MPEPHEQRPIENTPELEHVATLLLNGLLSNPALADREHLADANLKYFAGKAVKAACFLQEKLQKERNKG